MTETPSKIDATTYNHWYEEVEKVTIDTIGDFIKKLAVNYEHDFNSIVYAISIAVGATIKAMNETSQGGLVQEQINSLAETILSTQFGVKIPKSDN
jgi:hypothetical protein